jgi:hypothetical protein
MSTRIQLRVRACGRTFAWQLSVRCPGRPRTRPDQVSATLWLQHAPEYRAAAEQVCRLATERVANPAPGTTALERLDMPADQLPRLPTAVVLDLD